jgi:hypothetical protein
LPAAAQKIQRSAHVSRSAANDRSGNSQHLKSVSEKGAGSGNGHSGYAVQARLLTGSAENSHEKAAENTADTVISNEKVPHTGVSSLSKNSIQSASQQENQEEYRGQIPSSGSGKPIEPSAKAFMEGRFGRNFNHVRIHNNSSSAEMADSIRARAFTHGSDIYFNRGEYEPETEEGRHLLAHELTHTIQQGAGSGGDQQSGIVQPSRFRRFASSVGSRLRSAAEWVGDSLQAGLNWLRGRLGSMVSSLPGYGLFTVFLGRDPIAGTSVDRSGINFINHGLDVIPFGNEFKQKLIQENALHEAATFIDDEIAKLDISPSDIMAQFRRFWDGLSLSDVRDPGGVFDRLISIFSGPVNRIVTFAINLARKFLEIVKNYLLSKLREFVENQESPTWYPLLTVVLGHDPIMDVEVDRNGENILTGFIRLHPKEISSLNRCGKRALFKKLLSG